MANVKDYTSLITSEHSSKPKFVATVELSVIGQVTLQNCLLQMIANLDIDQAYGIYLDWIGQWVGLSRNINTPISNVYFSWDDTSSDGWDFGVWQGPFDPTSGITSLPDDIYRMILKGKIAANHWDGTIEDAYRILAIAFPNIMFVIIDNQNMSMTIGVSGPPLDTLTKTLISQGYLPIKPEGVRVNYYFTTVNAPLFAWDMSTSELAGWDNGAWGQPG